MIYEKRFCTDIWKWYHAWLVVFFFFHLKSHNGPIAWRPAAGLDDISCCWYFHKMLLNIRQRVQEDIAESAERERPQFYEQHITSYNTPYIGCWRMVQKNIFFFFAKIRSGDFVKCSENDPMDMMYPCNDNQHQYSLDICSSNSCISKQNRPQNMRCFPSHRGTTLCFKLMMFTACYSVSIAS